ncbi:3',5'-nucleoside bisphosphate phosphatase [Massilia antarctica]|uniref:3',5'-nucleoside bisphosphate phosphatase n=1 Tax=Massilia antarctica TaxID=2765360 RepID=UPI0006BB85CE|nr:3',5'-nucleoside bisphosphate phosphatase [Massilia sp. H27-R4]MCY0911515.1 PHP domain-containing protein [Massilia sp. H27-R4]CUI04877.1 COG0613, Predicted metal-dependent phosphoesterases (PHP family) [Janthinobacterium sp. CG23_2]CUU28663.1 COG0613, Predicted metal-dependent phosphoesterases (PHP family) [Janthinobacterium sp. CG23_2]
MLNVDLHCHSTVSDGVLAPAAVAKYAHKAGVNAWALTDHDEVGGVPAARAAAADLGMHFVSGVEISITWANHTVHIVGLQIDADNPGLVQGLAATRSGRDARGREMAEQLARAGIPGAYEGALKFVDNPDLMSRTHFARYLVESGVCANIPEVFRKYLVEGKPGYVPHRWASLTQAVGWIRGAGGIPVIAHPGRYKLGMVGQGALFDEFKQLGGTAIEVVTGSHTPDQYHLYAEEARRYGFLASRGTDFHAPGESRVDFAALPPLPSSVKPVWHDWF